MKFNKFDVKKVIAVLSIGAVVAGSFSACSTTDKKEEDNSDNKLNLTDDQLALLTFTELMQQLKAGLKKDNAQLVYNFLDNFNGNFADSLKLDGDQDHKFQITWDTAIAMRLAYNNFTATDMYEMFDDYELMNSESLKKLITNYTTMSIPAYLRLQNNTGIDTLINGKEAKDFYLKYENQLISINKVRFSYIESGTKEAQENFEAACKKMKSYIKADFLNDDGEVSFGSLNDVYISGSQASVVPIISAAADIMRNTPSKLKESQVVEINGDGYCSTIKANIEENLNKLETARVILNSNKITGEETTNETTTEATVESGIDIKYEIIRNAAIAELTANKKYYISDQLSTLPIYPFNVKVVDELTTQASAYISSGSYSRSKTTTKSYSSREDLVKDYPELEKEAKKQEEEISKKYKEENAKKKKKAEKEAKKKAKQKSKENKKKANEEISKKNEDAKVIDKNGNTYDNYDVKDGNTGNVVIDEDHTQEDENGNNDTNFDGPIYDKNGNVIAGMVRISFSKISSIFNGLSKNTVSNIKSLIKR